MRPIALLLGLTLAACSQQNPPSEASREAPETAPIEPTPELARPPIYGGMHSGGNVLEFNPRDLGEDWQQSLLPQLVADAPIWVSTSDYVVEAKIDRAELTREASDPKYLSMGTLKLHVRVDESLREEIVFVSLAPLVPKSWTVREATEEELIFARVDAKQRFEAMTGTVYTGPMTYRDSRNRSYTIDFERLGLGAFVVSTRAGDFLISSFQLPGDEAGHFCAFRGGGGSDWEETTSFQTDHRAWIPRLDVDDDGVPELLHSGPAQVGWDLTSFYPNVRTILVVSP